MLLLKLPYTFLLLILFYSFQFLKWIIHHPHLISCYFNYTFGGSWERDGPFHLLVGERIKVVGLYLAMLRAILGVTPPERIGSPAPMNYIHFKTSLGYSNKLHSLFCSQRYSVCRTMFST